MAEHFALGGLPKFYNLGQRPGRLQPMRMPQVHTGPINGMTGGRADARKMAVPAGSYVVPADIVSHLGQGNTGAGNRVLGAMFKTGPYGLPQGKMPRSRGVSMPKLASGGLAGALPQQQEPEAVPIFAADGEFVVDPETVAGLGGGDVNKGHAYLDAWVEYERQKAIKTLKSLPGPRGA